MSIQIGDKFYWISGDIITVKSIDRSYISYDYEKGDYYNMTPSEFYEYLREGRLFPLTPLLEALL